MALIDDFKARFLGDFTEQQIDDNWAKVDPEYSYLYPADLTITNEKAAALYLIAHLLSLILDPSSAAFRPEQSKSVKDVSTTYFVSQNLTENERFFTETKYGDMFLRLIANRIGAVFV